MSEERKRCIDHDMNWAGVLLAWSGWTGLMLMLVQFIDSVPAEMFEID